jgi:hypothetical protein
MDLEIDLEESRLLFRSETAEGENQAFDRAEQLRLTSGVLSYLRDTHPMLWHRVHETRGIGALNEKDHGRVREFKKLLEHLVRSADESKDHLRTVSYVSRSVLRRIRENCNGRPKLLHLRSKEFTHEHGVPVDAVIRIIVHPRNRSVALYELLSALSCRVLLLREQAAAVDRGFKAAITGCVKLAWGSYPAGSLPLRYVALARYHAANPALIEELVPISQRAATTLIEFKELLAGSALGEVAGVERMMFDHRSNPIAYIPDYVFDWSRV